MRHALSYLEGLGYLDDAAYARHLARRVVERQRGGPGRVRQALLARGLDRETVARVLAEVFPGGDDAAAALEAARRRLATLRGAPPAAARRRLAGYLARRGYAEESVAGALRALLGAEAFPEP